MAKVKYPPQAGEKNLCLSLFCTMMLSVISTVAIIYSIVIVYIPSITEIQSNLQGPKMCTTFAKMGNLTGEEYCTWTSCEEWCLSKSTKSCHHVKASVRDLGTTIYWDSCDFSEDAFVDHTCNTLDDLNTMNCKQFSYELGDKEKCMQFDKNIISCESGICKNVSEVYACTYSSRLEKLEDVDFCNCKACEPKCNPASDGCPRYPGKCLPEVAFCYNQSNFPLNNSMVEFCKYVGCQDCKEICHSRGECFNMEKRKDPTVIGQNEFGISVLTYYECKEGYCSEIDDLKCERTCDFKQFDTKNKNTMLFIGERIIMGKCDRRSTVDISDLGADGDTLMVACTNVTFDKEGGSMISQDCVNGTWYKGWFNGGSTNYSQLTDEYFKLRSLTENRVDGIANEEEITIVNDTQLRINIQGCVNTLSMECMAFYREYGKDGRNYTARAVYPCYYDPEDPEFVVIDFNPDQTLILLIFFVSIPAGIMVVSCCYMCGLSKFIVIADDGHMRLKCCGKYVTGIGNVPKWDPPVRKNNPLVKNEEENEAEDEEEGDKNTRDPVVA